MSTNNVSGAEGRGKERVGRRRFLGGVGAGGLAVAATVFGRATPASAATVPYGCCTLCLTSSSRSLASCQTGSYYTWVCNRGTQICECCEHYDGNGTNCAHTQWSKGLCFQS
jgi:hypothetical protein